MLHFFLAMHNSIDVHGEVRGISRETRKRRMLGKDKWKSSKIEDKRRWGKCSTLLNDKRLEWSHIGVEESAFLQRTATLLIQMLNDSYEASFFPVKDDEESLHMEERYRPRKKRTIVFLE